MKYEDKVMFLKNIKMIAKGQEFELPVWKIVLDRTVIGDRFIMEDEEEYGVEYSDFEVEYLIAIPLKAVSSIWGVIDSLYFRGDCIRWGNLGLSQYEYNQNVKYEDAKNLQRFKSYLEKETKVKVIL